MTPTHVLACLPCGCATGYFMALDAPSDTLRRWRDAMMGLGYVISETDVLPAKVMGECPHGPLLAQLAARLAAAEAREAELVRWLGERIAEMERADARAQKLDGGDDWYEAKAVAFREALEKLEAVKA